MKSVKFYLGILLVFSSLAFFSCSDDDKDSDPSGEKDLSSETHYDLWVTTENYGGGGKSTTVVQSVKSLDEQKQITFKGQGVDLSAKLFQETIVQGLFYYQIPREADRFGKYKITSTGVEVISEIPFKTNTLKDRRFAHAWVGDKTLVLLGANGDADKVVWIKLDTEKMIILDEGELDLPALPVKNKFSTSGMASYRKEDNMIIYSYMNNNDKTHFYAAFVNVDDMSVKTTVREDRAEQIGNTAYGELATNKSFFDPQGNFYLVCSSQIPGGTSTQQSSAIVRINKGAYEFDKTYLGFQKSDYSHGKIVNANYLSGNNILLYIQDPEHTGAEGWELTTIAIMHF